MTVLQKVKKLLDLYKQGKLGGSVMPEDANPNLPKDSIMNTMYFTLPMALNYQRNSYKLWEAALATYQDETTKDVFDPQKVAFMHHDILRHKLTKYKLALQPNKQPEIWYTLCQTFKSCFGGDVRLLFSGHDGDIAKIKAYILQHKKDFPYLSGEKILNYWLYVISQYTNIQLKNRAAITIAPDTHVLKASVKLGIITEDECNKTNIRETASARWADILKGTTLLPIDLHTPLWLWSRGGFIVSLT